MDDSEDSEEEQDDMISLEHAVNLLAEGPERIKQLHETERLNKVLPELMETMALVRALLNELGCNMFQLFRHDKRLAPLAKFYRDQISTPFIPETDPLFFEILLSPLLYHDKFLRNYIRLMPKNSWPILIEAKDDSVRFSCSRWSLQIPAKVHQGGKFHVTQPFFKGMMTLFKSDEMIRCRLTSQVYQLNDVKLTWGRD